MDRHRGVARNRSQQRAVLKPGDSVQVCIPVLAFEEGELTGVRYTGGTAYDDHGGQPIVWKP